MTRGTGWNGVALFVGLLVLTCVSGCLAPASMSSKDRVTPEEVEKGLQRQKEVNAIRAQGTPGQVGTGLDSRARDIERRLGYQEQ